MSRPFRAAALAAAVLAAPALAQPPRGTFVVHAIDVGTGLSVFVEGADFTLLYDAGSKEENGGPNNRVLAYLKAVRPNLATIDHLILSHPHEDHSELMPDVVTAYRVLHVWDSGSLNNICSYRALLKNVRDETGIAYHNASPGSGPHVAVFDRKRCPGGQLPRETVRVPRSSPIAIGSPIVLGNAARMTILHADGTRTNEFNEASVVVRLDLGTKKLLLAGDAEAGERAPVTAPARRNTVEADLLRNPGQLDSDILVVGHHGSKTSSRRAFLDSVSADHFIISSGPYDYGRDRPVVLPDPEVVTELQGRRGTTLWRTDLNDAACRTNPAKTGKDNDGLPGGCGNVRIVIDRAGRISGRIHSPD